MAGVASSHHRPISAFNPVWCLRPQASGRDTVKKWEDSAPTSTSSSSSSLNSSRRRRRQGHRGLNAAGAEPQSPRVGCMGQIKRDKAAGRGGSPPVRVRLLKLGKIFSGWSSPMCMTVEVGTRAAQAKAGASISGARGICMAELDPPLPVVKRAAGEANPVSLWRRRCGIEMALEGLQPRSPSQLPPLCVWQAAAA